MGGVAYRVHILSWAMPIAIDMSALFVLFQLDVLFSAYRKFATSSGGVQECGMQNSCGGRMAPEWPRADSFIARGAQVGPRRPSLTGIPSHTP